MAATQQMDRIQDEIACSICLESFKDPVTIDCGHNFCRACITQCWEGLSEDPLCPECRTACPAQTLRPNRELRNITEMLKLKINAQIPEGAILCPRHQQKLQLFCEMDQKPICLVCDRSREHRWHDVIPVEEAAQEYKTTFDSRINQLKKELQDLKRWAAEERKTSSSLEVKFKNETVKINGTFEQLQQFLENEKKKLLSQLEKEHELNMKSIQDIVSDLVNQQSTHTDLITEIEATCRKQDVELLKDVQSVLNRSDTLKARKPVDDVKVVQILQRVEHTHLQDKLMELKGTFPGLAEFLRMIKIYERAVTLDPDTAHRWLVLSEDGRSVRDGDKAQDLPDTPERYDTYVIVLGRGRLSSGRHYWEVEVGGKTEWDLGVCDESASRKGKFTATSKKGYWALCLRDGGKYSASTSPLTTLTPRAPPRVVGLFLDYEGGQLSFYNAQGGSLLHTFSGGSFPRTLRPYFSPCSNPGALQILPVAGRE